MNARATWEAGAPLPIVDEVRRTRDAFRAARREERDTVRHTVRHFDAREVRHALTF